MLDCHTRTLLVTSIVLLVLYSVFLLGSPLGNATVLYIHRAYVHKDIRKPNLEVIIGMLILLLFFAGSAGILSYSVARSCK